MTDTCYGSRYRSGLSTTEIAKLVRLDIKQAIKARTLPKGRYSVRSAYFANGSSITIRILDLALQVVSPQWAMVEVIDPGRNREPVYTPAAGEVLKTLEGLLAAYNYDGSDLNTDYFHVNFYTSVDFDWRLVEAQKAGLCQACKQLPLPEVA
jgi:hypothetical protein